MPCARLVSQIQDVGIQRPRIVAQDDKIPLTWAEQVLAAVVSLLASILFVAAALAVRLTLVPSVFDFAAVSRSKIVSNPCKWHRNCIL